MPRRCGWCTKYLGWFQMMRLSYGFFAAALSLAAARPATEPPTSAAPKKNVAVLYFDNYTGKPDYDPLGKGIASMMISDPLRFIAMRSPLRLLTVCRSRYLIVPS